MNEPHEDWLDEELRRLPDLKAPPELLPNVMRSVQKRSIRRWVMASVHRHVGLIRTTGLGFALAIVCLFPFLNPGHAISGFVARSPFFHFIADLLEVGQTILTELRIFTLPIGWLIGLLVAVSYLACVFAASTVQRLASVKRS